MNTTIRTTVRKTVHILALVVCVGTVSPAVAIPVPEPETYVASRPVETQTPTSHRCFPLVHVPGQDWLPGRRVG